MYIDWKATEVKAKEYILKYMTEEPTCLKTDLIYALESVLRIDPFIAEYFVKMALFNGVIYEESNQIVIHLTVPNPYPTLEEIENGRSENGGYTKAQLARWGMTWPPQKGWLNDLKKKARIRKAMEEDGETF